MTDTLQVRHHWRSGTIRGHVTPIIDALLMLCGFAAAVFATYDIGTADSTPRVSYAPSGAVAAWPTIALGFVLTSAWLAPGRSASAVWVGGIVAAVAAVQLLRPVHAATLVFAAGCLAALWSSLIQAQGLPQPLAMPIGAALPLVSASLSRRRASFAPGHLQEETLLAVLALGLAVAVAPTLVEGWRSAHAFNVADERVPPRMPAWTAAFAGLSAALGVFWTWWRRA
jgi:hypothetical protein